MNTLSIATESSEVDNASLPICATCSTIPWDILAGEWRKFEYSVPNEKTIQWIEKPICRLCHLMHSMFSSHEFITGELVLRQFDHSYRHETGRFVDILFEGESFCYLDYELFISEPSELESLYERFADPWGQQDANGVTFVQSSMDECNTHHGDDCRPRSRDSLQGLRVIDCKHRVIMDAPADAAFVALSCLGLGNRKPRVPSGSAGTSTSNNRRQHPRILEIRLQIPLD